MRLFPSNISASYGCADESQMTLWAVTEGLAIHATLEPHISDVSGFAWLPSVEVGKFKLVSCSEDGAICT
jgi:hypothetical protein